MDYIVLPPLVILPQHIQPPIPLASRVSRKPKLEETVPDGNLPFQTLPRGGAEKNELPAFFGVFGKGVVEIGQILRTVRVENIGAAGHHGGLAALQPLQQRIGRVGRGIRRGVVLEERKGSRPGREEGESS